MERVLHKNDLLRSPLKQVIFPFCSMAIADCFQHLLYSSSLPRTALPSAIPYWPKFILLALITVFQPKKDSKPEILVSYIHSTRPTNTEGLLKVNAEPAAHHSSVKNLAQAKWCPGGSLSSPWPCADLHSCQPETSSSLRYAKRRRIQWYWLIPSSWSQQIWLRAHSGIRAVDEDLGTVAPFVLHVPLLIPPVLLFTVEFFTGALFHLRAEPAVFGRAQRFPGSRSATRNAVIHRNRHLSPGHPACIGWIWQKWGSHK